MQQVAVCHSAYVGFAKVTKKRVITSDTTISATIWQR